MKGPVYSGFDMLPKLLLSDPGMMCLSPRELGQTFRRIFSALETGDADYLSQFSFVGRLRRPRVGRQQINKATRARIIARDGGACVQCCETRNLHIDHIWPVVWGGSNDDANLQTLCSVCNIAKGPKPHAKRPE